jgi:prophage antirepressor-like protein
MSCKIPINEIGPISMTMPIRARAPEPPSADLGTFSVGVVTIDGNAWFVAADVCRALGLTLTSGAVNHTTYFGAGKKQTVQAQTLASRKGDRRTSPASWAIRNTVGLISEGRLRKLIMRSGKPEARAFQDRVPATSCRRSARTAPMSRARRS